MPTTVQHDHAPLGALVMVLPDADAGEPYRARFFVDPEPRRVLVDEELAVEVEVVGVRAEEALDVRLAREDVEALVSSARRYFAADLRRALGLGDLDAVAKARFAKAGSDLEHAVGGFYGSGRRRQPVSRRRASAASRSRARVPVVAAIQSASDAEPAGRRAQRPLPRSDRASAARSPRRGVRERSRRGRAARRRSPTRRTAPARPRRRCARLAIAIGHDRDRGEADDDRRGSAPLRLVRRGAGDRAHCLT